MLAGVRKASTTWIKSDAGKKPNVIVFIASGTTLPLPGRDASNARVCGVVHSLQHFADVPCAMGQ